MHCALCELENLPATNTGICPDCWKNLNTSDFEGSIEIEVNEDEGKKQIKIKREK
tara:strand:+ start:33 stop:197 length:165 start_codon:yes stop_codon:yes gene_type:complete